MSDRNSFDYLNLDNFDESLDSRDYRRRRPERRGGSMSYSGRPSYDRRRSGGRRPNSRRPSSRRRRRRNRRRTRNRIVIVLSFLLVFALLITLIATMINGCGRRSPSVTTSTETKPPQQATVAATAPPARTSKEDMLSISNFIEPQPIDDNTDGEETGAIYVWNRNGFELFGGSEDSGVYYADNVNKLAAKIPTVNVYSMIVPNHTEMGLPARLRGKVNSNSQAANIKNASEYEEFREWAIESGVRDYALTNSPTAWLSFAIGSPALVASPQAGDLAIDEVTPITGSGKADFVFSLDKVAIGQNAQEARLKSVFSVVGGTDLDPSGFSEANLTFTLTPTGDGRVKATVTPKKDSDGNAPPSFFMRVKMK